ncbi:AMP dependent ligase/synthetase, putative [Entamoeba dispar SAW760]|uniref:AMP dependent ligase/synthetase, putative n=1 Tax=Entamoeba dispar (strain ATCC PRA-260 / SAW760) TaxID=370354 RepID=B0E638_ENTDS|nr:AMP dependent ligase/synthetase, putative [Entamoeba dispar SAW760]EDR30011.1 AMP dependent ligase/synthetase, putative [Entamoeba dispar SAW760]|eukprot:EDR30011.1 AMP dependent ligase/synthetase, putative [Entamoeba dispar SAW760]
MSSIQTTSNEEEPKFVEGEETETSNEPSKIVKKEEIIIGDPPTQNESKGRKESEKDNKVITPFKGINKTDLTRLQKYDGTYEDGRSTIQQLYTGLTSLNGMMYYQENEVRPHVSFKKFSNEIKIMSRAYVGLESKGCGVLFITNNSWKSYAMGIGCVLAGMYQIYINPKTPVNKIDEIIKQSNVVQIVTDSNYKDIVIEVIHSTKVQSVLIDGINTDNEFMSYDHFKSSGQRINDSIISSIEKEIHPTNIAEMVFVEGDKGIHGVIWTHGNIISECNAIKNSFQLSNSIRYIACHHQSYYLERIFSLYLPMLFGYQIYISSKSVYQQTLKHFVEIAKKFKPTLVFGVPRFYEKLLFRAKEISGSSKIIKKMKQVGVKGIINKEVNVSKPVGFGISKRLLFDKVKSQLGLVTTQYFLCSGLIETETIKEIMGNGIEVFCGLAFAETTGFCCLNREKNLQIDTVGRPLKGANILFKGRSKLVIGGALVAGGYSDGEIGEYGFDTRFKAKVCKFKDSSSAFVKLIEENSSFIYTSNGEQVPFKLIEEQLRTIPVVKNAMIIGNNKPYISCILSVFYEKVKEELKENCPIETQISKDKYFGTYLRQHIDQVNKNFSHSLQIKKFGVVLEGTDQSKWLNETSTIKERNEALKNFNEFITKLYTTKITESKLKTNEKEKEFQK